ncbi:MAG TPA: hypothetical protein VN924_28600 [Bryobacteraceae bacterium]|nr:hypothetical protein [Bryobacteraceae bacterium]
MTRAAQLTRALAHAKRLALGIEGITGVDFGQAYKDGKKTRRHGIRFHLAHKLHRSAVAKSQLLPKELHGFPCDVIQAAYQPHATTAIPQSPRTAFDPIRPGISVGNVLRTTTGTLGAIVRDAGPGRVACILSNWHVLCGSIQCVPGETVSQPGAFDAGNSLARVVASLARWARISTGCDAAIAAIDNGVGFEPQELTSGLAPARISKPKLNQKLVKSGIATRLTHGVVDGLGGSYKMDYSAYGDQVRWMDGIHIVAGPDRQEEDISLDGDSGSVWIEAETGNAVALHFGGEDGSGPLADYAVAHPMSRVCELLNIQFT